MFIQPEPDIILDIDIIDSLTLDIDFDTTKQVVIQANLNPTPFKCDQVLQGLSAYDIAVNNGFQGSINDWLNTLGKQYQEYIVTTIDHSVNIVHNLGYFPTVLVSDTFGNLVSTEIINNTINDITIKTSFDTTMKVIIK